MTYRSHARAVAIQLLYQQDLNPSVDLNRAEEFINERLHEQSLREFCRQLFTGVLERRKQLDAKIESTATNWTLKRMATTDRNVLRLGAYELLFTDTPDRVAIDEALELAKQFGDAHSSQFVNGILDRLMSEHSGDRAAETGEEGP